VFTADDLVLGYRIDGKLRGRDWQSLNVRNAQYPSAATARRADWLARDRRGARQGAHAAIHDGRGQPDGSLRADEMVARWSGRSPAVPRPRFTAAAAAPEPVINLALLYRL